MPAITQELLQSILRYDTESGLLFRGGRPITTKDKDGYVTLRQFGKRYLAHRVIVFYMTGQWPIETDHKNGIRHDNRWANLRSVTGSINQQNQRRPRSDNRTGFLGVCPNGSGYRAMIRANGQRLSLGTYRTAQEAYNAYVTAKRKLHQGNTL